jgi:hypothetical protein
MSRRLTWLGGFAAVVAAGLATGGIVMASLVTGGEDPDQNRWEFASAFSTTANPSGAWSWGQSDDKGTPGTFRLFPWHGVTGKEGVPFWTVTGGDNLSNPNIWRNTANRWWYGVPPGEVSFHPGPDKRMAVVRWTAPVTGKILVEASFGAGDTTPVKDEGNVDIHVVKTDGDGRATEVLFRALNTGKAEKVLATTTILAGETIDFDLGNAGLWYYDNTPIAATITLVGNAPPPPPAPPAAKFPADYRGEPWQGKAQTVPGRITAAFFDCGGEGMAYHDSDPTNHGSGELNRGPTEKDNFRKTEGVDTSYTKEAFDKWIEGKPLPPDQFYVGWTAPGEWLRYTVDVQVAGTYAIDLMASSNNANARISFDVNGVDQTGPITLWATGNWHTWTRYKSIATLRLDKGQQVITLRFLHEGNMSVLYFDLFATATAEAIAADRIRNEAEMATDAADRSARAAADAGRAKTEAEKAAADADQAKAMAAREMAEAAQVRAIADQRAMEAQRAAALAEQAKALAVQAMAESERASALADQRTTEARQADAVAEKAKVLAAQQAELAARQAAVAEQVKAMFQGATGSAGQHAAVVEKHKAIVEEYTAPVETFTAVVEESTAAFTKQDAAAAKRVAMAAKQDAAARKRVAGAVKTGKPGFGRVSGGAWQLAISFSATDNPATPWSWGETNANGDLGSLVLFPRHSVVSDAKEPIWAVADGEYKAVSHIWKNSTDQPQRGVAPGEISLHPGPARQKAVVRWTSPISGAVKITGSFGAGNVGSVDLFIVKTNGAGAVAETLLEAFNVQTDRPFSYRTAIEIGQTIDFAVGNAGGFDFDDTPLTARIEPVAPTS